MKMRYDHGEEDMALYPGARFDAKTNLHVEIPEAKMRYYHGGQFPPVRGTEDSAGLDIHHCGKYTVVDPGTQFDVKTDLHVEIPKNHVGLIVPRSGLGRKGIVLVNTVGVIDSDYRGEIGLTLQNNGSMPVTIAHGDRVAQMLIVPYAKVNLEPVDDVSALSETARGTGGFGSTGMRAVVSQGEPEQEELTCEDDGTCVPSTVLESFQEETWE